MANELTKIPKFRRCVLQNFPFIEQDFDALTDYQLLCKVVEYLNKVITSQNEVIEITKSLTLAFNELQSFVEHYFENLDVQEEINNKLDQMAEDGTLQEIIGSYLQSNVAWTFNTIDDMKNATNLVAGSYAQTVGFHKVNDGGGAMYYITDSGTANEMDVIVIGSLYANLVIPSVLVPEQVGAYGDGVHNDTTAFKRSLELSKRIHLKGNYRVDSFDVENLTIEGESNIVTITSPIHLLDNSKISNFTIKTISESDKHLIRISGNSDNVYNDITIDHITMTYDESTGTEVALTANYCKNLTITNCDIYVGGTELNHCSYFTINNNHYNGGFINKNEGIHTSVYSENGIISSNKFENLKAEAIDTFSSGNRIVITNNIFDKFRNTVLDIKVVLRDPPYTGGSSDQPEYGYTEFITVTGNIFTNLLPNVANAYFGVIQYYLNDQKSTPSHNNSNLQKFVVIDSNQFVNMYPQDNLLASGVKYQCIRVTGEGSVISNNTFSKLYYNDVNQKMVCAIEVGTDRNDADSLNTPRNIVICNNVISSAMTGIYLSAADRVVITGNTFTNDDRHELTNRTNIYIYKNPSNIIISGNLFESSDYNIDGSATTSVLNNFSIIDNIFDKGVKIRNIKGSKINANTFVNSDIHLSYTGSNSGSVNSICNNIFRSTNSTSYAIFTYSQDGLQVLGNTCEGYGTFTRLLGDCMYCNLSNNICKNVTTPFHTSSVTADYQSTITQDNNIAYTLA